MLKSIALYAVAAGAIFVSGMFAEKYLGALRVVEDLVWQGEQVNVLHKGEIKDAIKTEKTVLYVKTAPDATGCIPVRMRKFDIDALGGVRNKR